MKVNRTAKRTIEMVELISKNPNGMSLNEIVEEMCIPKTSAFDILHTLNELKMVEIVDIRTKIYKIGIRAFTIGNSYITTTDLINVAKPYLQELSDRMAKTVFIGKENDGKVVYLYKYEPSTAIVTSCKVGHQNEMYCTSLGKCILAFSGNYEEKINSMELTKKTQYTITDKKKLIEDIDKVNKRKYSVDNREFEEHKLCMSSPIFNHEGVLEAAISLSGIYVEGKDYSKEFDEVRRTGELISRKMGFSGEY